jgi:SOS regulatory protein LexA
MVRPPSTILTSKQRQILSKIEKFRSTEGYFPSTRELNQILRLKSSNTVFTHLKALIQKGYLKKNPKGKIIALAESPHQFQKQPLFQQISRAIGTAVSIPYFPEAIPAGFQAPAEDTANEMITVDQYLIKSPNNTFALKVKGLSMEKAGIMPGDLLLVEKRTDAKSGQIIVAHLPSGFTVKRLVEEQGRKFLKAESSKEYLIQMEEGTEIWGIVIGIVRKY